jgi:hypothetical protein
MNLLTWAGQAKRGERMPYFVGDLAYTRAMRSYRKNAYEAIKDERTERGLDRAIDAWSLYRAGLVTLTQRRLGDANFEYLAVKL